MNKATKLTVIAMIMIIVIYIVIGVVNNNINDNIVNDNINKSGDSINNESQQSGEQNQETNINDYTSNIKYDLTSGENEIVLSSVSSGEITTTTYLFENDEISKIVVTEEIISGDYAQAVYEGIKQDNSISQIYSSIDLKDNVITMILKQEYVDVFSGFTFEEIYEKQEEALNEIKNEN